MLELTFHNATRSRVFTERFVQSVLNTALIRLKLLPRTIEIGVFIVGQKRMRELNSEARGVNKPTNVLSFPIFDRSELVHALKSRLPIALGDIFVCLPIAQREARNASIRTADYLARLLIHGILHLAGYNHEHSPARSHAMKRLEMQILRAFQQS